MRYAAGQSLQSLYSHFSQNTASAEWANALKKALNSVVANETDPDIKEAYKQM